MSDKDNFSAYMRWQKYILGTHPELPKGCKRTPLIAWCLAMAIKGRNGLGCFASDETMGKEIGIANRAVVAKYHHLAVELGWFCWNGKRKGRAKVLDISIPQASHDIVSGDVMVPEAEDIPEVAGPPAEDTPPVTTEPRHDAWADDRLQGCPACKPLLGTRELAEVQAIHAGAIKPDVPLG